MAGSGPGQSHSRRDHVASCLVTIQLHGHGCRRLNELLGALAPATAVDHTAFSDPPSSIHNTANYAAVNVAAASTVGAGADTFIDCRTISGNGTNALTFSNGAISLASADTFSIADSATFITLNGTATISAATTYSGRGANTDSLTSQKRPANLSSFGVGTTGANTDVMQAVAGQTLAADAGARLSADA